MSDIDTTIDTTPEPVETERAKRERATFPIRCLPMLGATLADGIGAPVDGASFNTIEQADRWILASGKPGQVYLLARVIGGKRRPLVVVEDVAL